MVRITRSNNLSKINFNSITSIFSYLWCSRSIIFCLNDGFQAQMCSNYAKKHNIMYEIIDIKVNLYLGE